MSGLACATCHKFFRVKKVGVAFEEGMPSGQAPDVWQPYKLWMADLCECPGCGAQVVITGPHQGAVAEHYQPDYAVKREHYAPLFRVDDCGGKRP